MPQPKLPKWTRPHDPLADGDLLLSFDQDRVTLEVAPQNLTTADGEPLRSGETHRLPLMLQVEQSWLEIAASGPLGHLEPLRQKNLNDFLSQPTTSGAYSGPSSATIAKWLTDTGQLHRTTAGSAEFYADAARFAVETVGLDAAWILHPAPDNHAWQILGSHLPHPERGICFDPAALEQLRGSAQAWFEPSSAEVASQALVLAPVLDQDQQLIAAVYGVRDTGGTNRRRGVRPLEAHLIQLLAESVAVGIARLQQETEAARTRVLLEHAFSPTLASYIQQHPQSLAGQERETTLLFADLRGFTALAETLEPAACDNLLGEVMETLTQVVLRQQGIVVDYYGDGLLALWNAPLDQPNHADLACAAAVQMLEAMPTVSQAWKTRLGAPLELGIGIHSGLAYVGNAGTRSRLKYGPRGNTVNVASRVQSASKQLQLPLLITAATQAQLSEAFCPLRVCTAKLPDLEQPTQLFTVYPAAQAAQIKSRLDQYTQALTLFEAGELEAAEVLLQTLDAAGPTTPAQFLAHYTSSQKQSHQGRRAVDKTTAQGSVIEILSK